MTHQGRFSDNKLVPAQLIFQLLSLTKGQ